MLVEEIDVLASTSTVTPNVLSKAWNICVVSVRKVYDLHGLLLSINLFTKYVSRVFL